MRLTILSFFLLGFILNSGYSQYNNVKEMDLKRKFWDKSDQDFQQVKCDERWKDESAVFLCRSYEYQVRKEILLNILYENIYTHNRILLKDKAAVDEFSTFSFDVTKRSGLAFGFNNYSNVYLGLKVIKPDGAEKEIEIDKKLVDEYRQGITKQSIQKIAVPNLEPGDIIDYYTAIEKQISVNVFYPFSPVIYPLVDDHPVQKQKVELHIMRKCFLNARSMNGAPEFVLNDDSKRSDMVYSITDVNRDKIKTQLFVYLIRELPVIAFQTYYVNSPMVKNRYCFYDREEVVKRSITDEELKAFVQNLLLENNTISGKIIRYLNKEHKNVTDKNFLIREAYYYYRQIVYGRSFENRLLGHPLKYNIPSDIEFVRTMSEVLKSLKVSHSLEIGVPREIGSLDDMIMINQMGMFIKINVSSELKYLFNFNAFRLIPDHDPSYENIVVKELSVPNNLDYLFIRTDTINCTPAYKNSQVCIMDVKFSAEEADTVELYTKITAKGALKSELQEISITAKDYAGYSNNNPYYNDESEISDGNSVNKLDQIYKSSFQERDKDLMEYFKGSFEVDGLQVSDFSIQQPGIWESEPEFKCSMNLKFNRFITKAGNNIILNVGQLIGVQVRPEKKDSVRFYDIYMPFARTYENTLNIAIPEGYKLTNIEKLNFNITNSTGGFISSAKLDGNKLIVNTRKYFSSNYFTQEYWPEMLKFINAANDFYNQRVMFTPL